MSSPERPAAPASESRSKPAAPAAPADRGTVRPIPTPGDLFPRGVRPAGGQDEEELATGTG